MSQRTTTRVQLVVEVFDSQPWGDDSTVGEIYKRAKENAMMQVESAIQGKGIRFDASGHIRIVGDMNVSMVMAENTRDG